MNSKKITVQYDPRICDAHAHSLAKFGLGKKNSAVWLGSLQAKIQNVLDVL